MQYPPPKSPCPRPGCGVLCGRAGGRAAPRPARRRAVGGLREPCPLGLRRAGKPRARLARRRGHPARAPVQRAARVSAPAEVSGGSGPRVGRPRCCFHGPSEVPAFPEPSRRSFPVRSGAMANLLFSHQLQREFWRLGERLEKTAERCSLALTRGERGRARGRPWGAPPPRRRVLHVCPWLAFPTSASVSAEPEATRPLCRLLCRHWTEASC